MRHEFALPFDIVISTSTDLYNHLATQKSNTIYPVVLSHSHLHNTMRNRKKPANVSARKPASTTLSGQGQTTKSGPYIDWSVDCGVHQVCAPDGTKTWPGLDKGRTLHCKKPGLGQECCLSTSVEISLQAKNMDQIAPQPSGNSASLLTNTTSFRRQGSQTGAELNLNTASVSTQVQPIKQWRHDPACHAAAA